MGAAATLAARRPTVICHRQFLSHRIRILSYVLQLPFKVGKFADSILKNVLNGMMSGDNQELLTTAL